MTSVRLREAGAADAPALARLLREAFEEFRGRLDPPSSAHGKTAEAVLRELAGGGALIADVQGAPVGCVFFHPKEDHVYLDRLAVLPAFRGAGVGAALMDAVEAGAEGLGAVRLSVRLALTEQQRYYARRGYVFHAHGTHAGYDEPTFLVLQKPLRAG
ncbi:GNAT family N-acetyltransferase [Aggregicoccus sp. 17bor-14]|uniref:GNAT family N-acetyltransferase n=1 Tax=Myxococcaceae TaxID=31 RepID=UPI00129C16F8|nr:MULTISPECIES: GNAT family N-acetyltransferase [Myxococcaceae]MBF5046283.1 GNAT family N-acetyltransferase [Simulacricoccus sp. 17bor-14]MRI92005.1 GNAT family N-acetyltransferase [Aggregicoccus sp. 17bor-14]